jgi:phosphatidylserine/phosphatidylglycerophosphate/cardiolipin synthase-like enzyme
MGIAKVREQSQNSLGTRSPLKLLIQPGEGVQTLVKGIASAKHTIEIAIFRLDQSEVEQALASAVSRGVSVNALIAATNSTGEENLRKLELRLLASGVTVARTADDLARYHGKLMIIDQRVLYLMAFNLTHADIDRSRSFGLITTSHNVVREVSRLFDADRKRIPYKPALQQVVVSPANARTQLAAFIRHAKKELIIYDPRVSDRAMMRLLEERAQAGVNVRLIGRLAQTIPGVSARKLVGLRLHTRTMVRDREAAFIGSQSLRQEELDARREVGLIFRHPKTVLQLLHTFEDDWALAERAAREADAAGPEVKIARKVAKAVAKELPATTPLLNGDPKLQEIVKEVVMQVVKHTAQEPAEDSR